MDEHSGESEEEEVMGKNRLVGMEELVAE